MSYFSGLSKDPVPLAESAKMVMMNLFMILGNTYDPYSNAKKNYIGIKDIFAQNYKYDKAVQDMLKKVIVSSCAKDVYQPIDYSQLTKFIRFDLDVDVFRRVMNKVYIYKDRKVSHEEVFAILLKSVALYSISTVDRMSKLQLPVFVDGRYCSIISFDENDIHQVMVLASKNMYDIKEPIKFIRVDTDTNFDKSLFMI